MSNENVQMEFSNLPPWVQQKIRDLDIPNPGEWIQKKIPALGGFSVVEILDRANGEEILRGYFAKVEGRF